MTDSSKHKHAVSSAFGALASVYDSWYESPLGRYVWIVEKAAMQSMIPSHVSGVVVDVGAGTGMSMELLQGSKTELVGIDISWQMLQEAYQKSKECAKIHLITADGEKLPLRRGVVKLVLGMTVLEFVTDPLSLLREIHAILSPLGWLVLGVLTSTSMWAIERRVRNLVRPDVFALAWFPSPWQLIRLLHQASFSSVQYQGSVYAPTITPSRLLPTFTRLDTLWGRKWIIRSFGAFLVIQARRVERSEVS